MNSEECYPCTTDGCKNKTVGGGSCHDCARSPIVENRATRRLNGRRSKTAKRRSFAISAAKVKALEAEISRLRDEVKSLEAISSNARQWFFDKRPDSWGHQQHIENPVVNCSGFGEVCLAKAVALYEKEKPAAKAPEVE